jgi:hypothetical protein
MRSFQISDRDLQALIAPALRAKLAAAGFKMGAVMDGRSGDPNCAFYFPINLNLAGDCGVRRDEDGTWTISQEESPLLADRTAETFQAHVAAIASQAPR